ncbi:site-specific DNA-methyltransferase [Candidatus Parcubacteria bacterium]|nr:site-specific DNA-methyltransferase [Candidatus Parcubacteria bacterium]
MANNRKHKGSLRLDWINKDLSLYYEIDEKQGKGVRPVWVPKNDIRVAEPRILKFVKSYGDSTSENILIKGDNLLVLRSLVEMFKGREEKNKVKCIYIDPPFNTGNAFERYDDNLKHSEWLTMMRDRLYLLRKLMRKDGVLFVHIDDEEMAYLKVLLDEVFGRENFLAQISWERSPVAGLGQGGKLVVNVSEYILSYAKEKINLKINDNFRVKKIFEFDKLKGYNQILVNEGKKKLIKEFISKSNKKPVKIYKHENYKIERLPVKELEYSRAKFKTFYKNNFDKVFRTFLVQKENKFQHELMAQMDKEFYSVVYTPSRGKNKGKLTTNFYFKKELCGWLSSVASLEKGVVHKFEKPNDFWTRDDVPFAARGEGGIKGEARSIKPEGLMRRLIEMTTNPNDFVMDIFAFSGTTGAVAQKMNRRWIMTEIGRQAEELIIPRLNRVADGKDQRGISEEVSWQGGGGFKYYKLGESLIHKQDMNWALKVEEMAEAVFLHFQYRPAKADWLKKENMYLGRHQFARYHFALSFATREIKVLTEDLYEKIIVGLNKEKFKHLTIFTNVAVAVPPESLDERVLVKKIPAAILREYNLL